MAKWTEEDRIQALLINWRDRTEGLLREAGDTARADDLHLLHSNPMGFRIPKSQRGKFKATGARAGIPDLFLPVPRVPARRSEPVAHGLWVEMKTPTGRQSKAQKKIEALLVDRGYVYALCRSARDAARAIMQYLDWPEDEVDQWLANIPTEER